MIRLFLSALTICSMFFLLSCNGSDQDTEQASQDTASAESENVPEDFLDQLNKDNIEEMYDQIVLGKAPEFVLYTLDHTKLQLSDYRGYVVLLNFWSTQSATSKQLFPLFTEVHNMYRDSGFVILAMNIDRMLITKIQEYADFNRLSYTITYPQNNAIFKNYGTNSPDMSFLIDRQGNIVGQFQGNPGRERLIKIISLFI